MIRLEQLRIFRIELPPALLVAHALHPGHAQTLCQLAAGIPAQEIRDGVVGDRFGSAGNTCGKQPELHVGFQHVIGWRGGQRGQTLQVAAAGGFTRGDNAVIAGVGANHCGNRQQCCAQDELRHLMHPVRFPAGHNVLSRKPFCPGTS